MSQVTEKGRTAPKNSKKCLSDLYTTDIWVLAIGLSRQQSWNHANFLVLDDSYGCTVLPQWCMAFTLLMQIVRTHLLRLHKRGQHFSTLQKHWSFKTSATLTKVWHCAINKCVGHGASAQLHMKQTKQQKQKLSSMGWYHWQNHCHTL